MIFKYIALLILVFSVALPVPAGEREEILKNCQAAIHDGVYELAQKQIDSYLEAYADKLDSVEYEDAIVLKLRALYGLKKYEHVISLMDTAVVKKIKDTGLMVYWRNLIDYDKGNYQDVLSDTDNFSKRHQGSKYAGQVERLRAWCWLKTGETGKALASFEMYDKNYGTQQDGPNNLLEWGKLLVCASNNVKAIEVFERLSTMSKKLDSVSEGTLWLGRIYIEQGMHEKSALVLKALTSNEQASDDLKAGAWYSLADLYINMTNSIDAIAAISNGIQIARSPMARQKGRLSLGKLYLSGSRIDEGVAMLKSYVSEFPDNPSSGEVQSSIADALLDAGKNKESVDEYQYYIETFTNTIGLARAYYGRGWGLINTARYAESAASFLKAYDLFPAGGEKEKALFKAGDAYFFNSQFKLAAETYDRFIRDFPSSLQAGDAMFQRGESMARLGEYAMSEAIFLEIVARYSSNVLAEDALLRIAELKESQGLLRDAIIIYSQLLSQYPNSKLVPDALHGRGLVYFQQWRFKIALVDFERVVNDFPESKVVEECYYKRGMCYYWLGHDETALSVCESFIKRYPNSEWTPFVLYWTGKYYFNHSDYQKSESVFRRFASQYGDHALADDALLWAGHSLAKRREYVGSIELFAKFAKDFPDSSKMAEARFAQGEALCEIANYAAAILLFDEIINKYADSYLVEEAWIRKGDCQFTLGVENPKRYEESMESYRVVANSSSARLDFIMQSEYKIGRCLEKMGRTSESFEHYYQKVIIRFYEDREKGVWQNESCKKWFISAAFNAADVAEGRNEFKMAASILDRVIQAGMDSSSEAKRRIDKIKSEHWWLFYSE